MDNGIPTAGLRLEIPEELMGQFRLLSRFGARLRARHGSGTKRHIKFDDLEGALFMNIKLPGDEAWSRVTAETARLDMERTARDESASVLKRIHAKPMPVALPTSGPGRGLPWRPLWLAHLDLAPGPPGPRMQGQTQVNG